VNVFLSYVINILTNSVILVAELAHNWLKDWAVQYCVPQQGVPNIPQPTVILHIFALLRVY